MLSFPNSRQCADTFGEGPDTQEDDDEAVKDEETEVNETEDCDTDTLESASGQQDLFSSFGIAPAEKPKPKENIKKSNVSLNSESSEKPYTGVRKVYVYGQELFIVEDPKVTNEQIRKRLVEEFKYPEFSAERTEFSLDKQSDVLVAGIKFQKKG